MCKEIYQKIKELKCSSANAMRQLWRAGNQKHLFSNSQVDRFFNGIFWIVFIGGLAAIIAIIIWILI